MPNQSYWEIESFFKNIDVAIIGSGIVGLNAAIRLKELSPTLKVVVLEKGSLPIGASTRNAGFACFGSMTELLDDLEKHSEDEVFSLVEKRWKGLLRLRKRIGDKNLKYQEWGGYELFRPEDENDFQQCIDKIDFFNHKIKNIIGKGSTFKVVDEKIKTFGFQGINHLIHNQAEGQIHTGEMMRVLLALARAKGIEIMNGISIKKINDLQGKVELIANDDWKINVRKVLVATNGFAKSFLQNEDITPARNQVIITKPIKDLQMKGCFHYDKGYFYFRNIDGRILLGGGRNLAKEDETTTEFGFTTLIQNALHDLLRKVILPNQNFEIEHQWSGILGVGESKKPIVKKVNDNVFVSVRLGGMGVAIGSLVGEEGAELLLENIE